MSKKNYIKRRLKEKQNNADFLAKCDFIKQELQAGLVIKPQWWTDLKKKKLKSDKEYLRPEGMVLIQNIPVDKLINKIKSVNSIILKQEQLFHDKLNQTKTFRVIDHWRNGEKLFPATIFWSSNYNSIEIENGRHRLNVAICLGEKYVPIMISSSEYYKVLQHLNLD